MSKHIASEFFYNLPSGSRVHPCRLILKDGTLMWKHALLHENIAIMPTCEAHETHIIKTAQRLEELNSWVSYENELWDCFIPLSWYCPYDPEFSEGISVNFKHSVHESDKVFDIISSHILPHERLERRHNYIHFRRC